MERPTEILKGLTIFCMWPDCDEVGLPLVDAAFEPVEINLDATGKLCMIGGKAPRVT